MIGVEPRILDPAQEETTMIIPLLLGLVADLVFDSAAARHRAYESEIDRYFAERGFVSPAAPSVPRAR
jgi:hypothetical protein